MVMMPNGYSVDTVGVALGEIFPPRPWLEVIRTAPHHCEPPTEEDVPLDFWTWLRRILLGI